MAVEAVFSPDIDASERSKEMEAPIDDESILKELPDEDVADQVGTDEMIQVDAKQNDINESFRRFFSNISLKLTVKRGSADKDSIVKQAPSKQEDLEDSTNEIKEQNTDPNRAQEAHDDDFTTCKTLADAASLDCVEKTVERTEAKEKIASCDAATGTTLLIQENGAPEEERLPTSPAGSDGKEITTPFKRFFTTGIFSSFRKRKSLVEDKVTEKELLEKGVKTAAEPVDQSVQNQHEEKEVSSKATTESENGKEERLTSESIQDRNEVKPPSEVETDIINTQENDKVQASPLKRLMSSSSFKRLSKKQTSRKSSDAKRPSSGEYSSDQLQSSTESADHQRGETPAQPSAQAAGGDDGAWASFRKLMTPQKHKKTPSLDHEERQTPGGVDGTKPGKGEQTSDHSTEEGKKRKDSSVSWEAVLCGSGRRRSRKTSDSDDETPPKDDEDKKQDSEPKETPLESPNEVQQVLPSSLSQSGSPSEGDEGTAWKSLKNLVNPKRKVKDDDVCLGEAIQDDSSFFMKKLLPSKKDRKSAERQSQVSSDEADQEVASGDEDSETPAVVPLSEFDTAETLVQIQVQADIQSYKELQNNLYEEKTESALPCDLLPTETNESPKEALGNEEPDELTESTSKHQQLSDIPEEGVVTEPTPAVAVEEAARDETIAEDLIEITSEAITAPEPVDASIADETEMVSAVSQLIESSNTSGNMTPVPAEYIVLNTELLLQQVSDTISLRPAKVPVCSEEPSSDDVSGSIYHQVFESSVPDHPRVLEIHSKSDATALETGLDAEEIDAVSKLAATVQTENVFHFNEVLLTEIVSEVPIEKFDTATYATDETYQANVLEVRESIKELEMSDESQDVVEHVSAMSTENLPTEEEGMMGEKSFSKTDYQEEEVFVTSADKDQEEPKEEPKVATQVKADVEDAPQRENVEEAPTPDVEAGSPESPKEELKPDTGAVEAATDEPKQTTKTGTESEEEMSVKPEVSSQDATAVTETDTSQPPAEHIEEIITQELERQTLLEDAPQPEQTEIVTEEDERKAGLEKASEKILKGQEPQSLLCDVQAEHEETTPEDVEEKEASTAVHIPSANKEPGSAQVLQKTMSPEKTPTPCSDESLHQLQESVNMGEAHELPGTEVAKTDHGVTSHEVARKLKDASSEKLEVSAQEPLMDQTKGQTEFNEALETAAPLVRDMNETAMVHVSSVENHRVQLQVTDEIRSAESTVDTVLEVGVTEAKEVIHVCLEPSEDVENLSAASEIEEYTIREEVQVTVREVIQHVEIECPGANVGSAVDSETKVKDQKESAEAEDQPTRGKSDTERQDEEVISEQSATTTEPQGSEGHEQTSGVPERTKVAPETSEVCATTEDVRTENLAELRENTSESQRLQPAQSHVVTQSITGLHVPQAPASPPAETAEPLKWVERSAAGAQAVESAEQKPESPNPTERAAQATERSAAPTLRAVIATQPLCQNIGTQGLEPEPAEQTLKVQAAEALQLERRDETAEHLSEPRETKTEEPLKQAEEENDKDEWLDAEEHIEPAELLTDTEEGKRAEPEVHPENKESPQKPAGTLEHESEGEDFAVALEDLESSSSVGGWN
ncbi:A-kinase anchor protein 12 [Nematolebias whitei]|uniref:A-kinase anchor protein 12 n=1 Tax=Nematolebias whitei TaxID=451745 RepID=UPI0018997D91|nr:A-kinase anchor protein 12 [Nematolebias whitei]